MIPSGPAGSCGESVKPSAPERPAGLFICSKENEENIMIGLDRIIEAIELDNLTGFCTTCGADFTGYEPDARECECELCGQMSVYGAEELLF